MHTMGDIAHACRVLDAAMQLSTTKNYPSCSLLFSDMCRPDVLAALFTVLEKAELLHPVMGAACPLNDVCSAASSARAIIDGIKLTVPV